MTPAIRAMRRAACSGDILPAAPIAALCGSIDASPDHVCVLDPMPDDGHITCAFTGIDKCLAWFDAL